MHVFSWLRQDFKKRFEEAAETWEDSDVEEMKLKPN